MKPKKILPEAKKSQMYASQTAINSNYIQISFRFSIDEKLIYFLIGYM